MSAEEGFLRSVAREPDDDTPRLVYADWLDEHDQSARAEFIRLQIALARDKQDSLPRRERAFRARQLLEENEKQWVDSIRDGLFRWQFIRGFIERVEVISGELEETREKLFEFNPVRRMWVTDLFGDVSQLELIPPDNHLIGLDLCGNQLDLRAIRSLARSPQFPHLQSLTLMFNRIDDEGAQFLCDHPFFQRLKLLRCGGNPISAAVRQKMIEYFGDRITFVCERDADHIYAFQDGYFTVGFGLEFTQIMAFTSETQFKAAIFDHEGNLLEIRRQSVHCTGESPASKEEQRRQVRGAWLDANQFRKATIKVRRFYFQPGNGINDFNFWQNAFNRDDDPDFIGWDRDKLIERWLVDGQFEWDYGGHNCWFDGNGEVTDT